MAAERGPFLARGHIPKLDASVVAGGSQKFSIEAEDHSVNPTPLVPLKDSEQFPRGHIPKLNGIFLRT